MPGDLPARVALKQLNVFMPYYLNVLFSFSVAPGAVIGWVRLKKTDPAFYPFVFLLTAGLVHETLSFFILKSGNGNALSYTIFSLVEVLVICVQFYRWGLFDGKDRLFRAVLVFCAAVWLLDLFILQSPTDFNSYAIILHSFVIVVMSIHMINHLIFMEIVSFIRHPVFLICLGFIIYFTYAILVEMFLLFGLTRSNSFQKHISDILACVNLLTNLMYALAILWMPMKPRYIMPY